MELSDREKDLSKAGLATIKSALSIIPGLGQALAGWDAYNRSIFERSIEKTFQYLSEKIDNIEDFCRQDFFQTEEGQQFARKVIDASLDPQLEDKQQLFINALISGANNKSISELEKLKFVDMLRYLSLASLMVLAEMHKKLIEQVRGPGRQPKPNSPYPLVDPTRIAENLSDEYDPYLVTSSISEMESQGLFSSTGEWIKDLATRQSRPGGGFDTALSYTDFTARFVEFIWLEPVKGIDS